MTSRVVDHRVVRTGRWRVALPEQLRNFPELVHIIVGSEDRLAVWATAALDALGTRVAITTIAAQEAIRSSRPGANPVGRCKGPEWSTPSSRAATWRTPCGPAAPLPRS